MLNDNFKCANCNVEKDLIIVSENLLCATCISNNKILFKYFKDK